MAERMTLCDMSAELGAQVGLVAPDQATRRWLWPPAPTSTSSASTAGTATKAPGVRHNFDASTLAPQIALPHSPAQARDVGRHRAHGDPDRPHRRPYTGGKLDDLRAAARVLAGYHIDPRVRLLVAPASLHERQVAESEGILRRLQEAGAEILPAACGLCAGHGNGVPEDSTVISSIARNSKGRLGSDSARVFLASPYTVAASALRGRITDPREVLWDADVEGAR